MLLQCRYSCKYPASSISCVALAVPRGGQEPLLLKVAPTQPSVTAAFRLQSQRDNDCQMWELVHSLRILAILPTFKLAGLTKEWQWCTLQAQFGLGLKLTNWIEDQFQSSPKLVGICTVLRCIFVRNLEIVTWIGRELWHAQAQNGIIFYFEVEFVLEGQGQPP